MPTIIADGIRRSFRSVKKQEGLRGSLNLLLKPEYQEHDALKGVSFQISEGEFVGLIGANGAGKTTLLKILSGLIPPTSGRAQVMGYTPFDRSIEFRRRISLVMGQKAQLWWDLPGIDAFDLLRAIYEIPKETYRKRLDELASMLDVTKHLNTQIRRLSLGERMKMELIGALLHWPDVVYLDEPTIGLDVVAAQSLREFLKGFNLKDHRTVILTSHNMDDIERLCARVLIIQEGQLVYDGSPQHLMGQGEKRLRVRLAQVPSLEELSRLTKIPQDRIELSNVDEKSDGESESASNVVRFKVGPSDIPVILEALFTKMRVVDMGVEEQSLEDVIQRLFLEGKGAIASPREASL